MAGNAATLVWRRNVPLMSKADAAPTLQDEEVFSNLGHQMVSRAAEAQTLLVVRVRTALTEDQRPFARIVSFEIASVTFLSMSFSKWVMFRNP